MLEGLLEATEGGPPKKSRPSNELPESGCLGAPEDFPGDGRVPGVSVVLGLAGGDGKSPKISAP